MSMDVLLGRLQGPLMSCGGPAIDDVSPAGEWPTRSQLTGLFGCALGLRRERVAELSDLQSRLSYAVRCDRRPSKLVDFQTVMTYTEDMRHAAITPQGWASYREPLWLAGNPVIRRREYLVDGEFIFAVALRESKTGPSVQALKQKLDRPEGAIFIGRRACSPSCRIAIGVVRAKSLLEALRTVPGWGPETPALWPESEGTGGRVLELVEDKDWANGVHVGRRRMRQGFLVQEGSCT